MNVVKTENRSKLGRSLKLGALVLAAGIGYSAHHAHADIPNDPEALVYSGIATDANGAPLTPSATIGIAIFDAATNGSKVCEQLPAVTPVDPTGRFRIDMGACVADIHAAGNLWVEVTVESTPLGRSKIGAVPYAIEASHASSTDNATAGSPLAAELDQLMPPKTIITVNLTPADITQNFSNGLGNSGSAYQGWAICNGLNGTPNLANRFVRINTTGAGLTGGNDSSAHTHGISHDHGSFTSGAESAHTHSTPDHYHRMPVGADGAYEYWALDGNGVPIFGSSITTSNRLMDPAAATTNGQVRLGLTEGSGVGTTGPGSAHTHEVDVPAFTGTSGAASATDNRPAYFELVALMRL